MVCAPCVQSKKTCGFLTSVPTNSPQTPHKLYDTWVHACVCVCMSACVCAWVESVDKWGEKGANNTIHTTIQYIQQYKTNIQQYKTYNNTIHTTIQYTKHITHQSVWINKSLVNPKSNSNQSSKPCTALQYPSRKVVYISGALSLIHAQSHYRSHWLPPDCITY